MSNADRMFEIVKKLLTECHQFPNGCIQLGSVITVEEKGVMADFMVQHMFGATKQDAMPTQHEVYRIPDREIESLEASRWRKLCQFLRQNIDIYSSLRTQVAIFVGSKDNYEPIEEYIDRIPS